MKSNDNIQINELEEIYKQLKEVRDLIKQLPISICVDTIYGPFQASGTKEECDEKLKNFLKCQEEKNVKPIEWWDKECVRISEEYQKHFNENEKPQSKKD